MNQSEIIEELENARPYFYNYSEPVKVYLHWTAGHRYTSYEDYHFCIDGDGEIVDSLPLTDIPTATWRRNRGSIAIALCACYGAMAYRDSNGGLFAELGNEAPTDLQIESMAWLMAKIADIFEIPIDEEHFLTHAEVAQIDNYDLDSNDPDARWDLAVLTDSDSWMSGGDVLRGKANWYAQLNN